MKEDASITNRLTITNFTDTDCAWDILFTIFTCTNITCHDKECWISGEFSFMSVLYLYTDTFKSNITNGVLFGSNGSVVLAHKHYFSVASF